MIITMNSNQLSRKSKRRMFKKVVKYSTHNILSYNKPKLIFRILDSELKYEPAKLLEKTMSNKNDQYQNTREAMMNLFSGIELLVTNSLDRNEKKLLKENK